MELYVDIAKHKREVQIFLVKDEGNKEVYYSYSTEGLVQTTVDKSEFAEVAPFIKMPTSMFDTFLKLMVDYASSKRLRTDYESILTGKLEAKNEHMRDLQMIVKKLLKMDN